MTTDTAPTTAAEALAHLEAQGTLEPGTPGYWKVWGATPHDLRAGDIVLSKDGDAVATDYVADTFTAKAAPMRVGFIDAEGNRLTLGALTPVTVLRWGTAHTLTAN